MGNLDGQVAVITGGSRGLGFGMAKALAEHGAAVVVASRSASSVAQAVEELRSQGAKAAGFAVDVSQQKEMEELARFTLQEFGKIDIWINNAGVAGAYGPTLDGASKEFYQVVQTNIIGVYNGSRVALKYFVAKKQGKLVNVLGHGANGPVAFQNGYASSKAWVRSFTIALAKETKDSGVGVFAFNPGMVLTELLTNVDVIAGSESQFKIFPTLIRMWAQPPEKPAEKLAWLVSSATDGKTGLVVNYGNAFNLLIGAVKEGWRWLFHLPEPPISLKINTVPPANE